MAAMANTNSFAGFILNTFCEDMSRKVITVIVHGRLRCVFYIRTRMGTGLDGHDKGASE
jgi:hypothetical protein